MERLVFISWLVCGRSAVYILQLQQSADAASTLMYWIGIFYEDLATFQGDPCSVMITKAFHNSNNNNNSSNNNNNNNNNNNRLV